MFRPYDIILKKRRGEELTPEELRFLVQGYVRGEVADYQLSAWAMAVCFQGMTGRELAALTEAMVESGETVDLSELTRTPVDKHSTGGVGDKTSLVLIPLVAACGLPVAKLSGRGLGHTGGTLDKLESIPGFRTNLSLDRLVAQVKRIGLAVAGQTADLVPADRKLYALRDVTATVDSIPLIASSIMSKKIAGGAHAIVLDVKVGQGAFMKTIEEATALAGAMVEIGSRAGRKTRAVLSNMDQPLGLAVGNALEVREALDTLKKSGPPDLRELCITLGGLMCYLGGAASSPEEGRELCRRKLANGSALARFAELVEAQGGNPRVCDEPSLLPSAPVRMELTAPAAGWVAAIDALVCGQAAVRLGAGRVRKEDSIDPRTGLVLKVKVGDRLEKGQTWVTLHAASETEAAEAGKLLQKALRVSPDPVELPQLILGEVGPDDVGSNSLPAGNT